jgi:hypothetical protein
VIWIVQTVKVYQALKLPFFFFILLGTSPHPIAPGYIIAN